MAISLISIEQVKAQSTSRKIEIQSDGSITDTNPLTPIQQNGNVYTFTGDIQGRIDIRKSNIILDGAGYSLKKGDLDFAVIVGTSLEVPETFGVDGITIRNLEIVGFDYGITLGGQNNIVSNVNITEGPDYNGVPIWVSGSNHIIQGCRITGNKGYGMLIHAKGAVISDNYIADNGNFGITFEDNAAVLRNNKLNNNGFGPFHMDEMSMRNPGQPFQIASNEIDASNMVDGKPVCYWVGEHDKTVPSSAGYVVLDNCTNISVKNLSVNRDSTGYYSRGAYSVSLIRTRNSDVSNNTLNGTGIYISHSTQDIVIENNSITIGGIYSYGSNISIIGNSVLASKDTGVTLSGTGNAVVAKNILSQCGTGISKEGISKGRIIQNTITNCDIGISIFSSDNNGFYRNNFINNKQQVSEQHYALQWPLDTYYQSFNNTWDNNFWSNYNGADANSDGIGDTSYDIFENYTDYHPSMALFAIDSEISDLQDLINPSPMPTPSSPLSSPSSSENVDASETIPEFLPTVPILAALASALLIVSVSLILYFKKKMQSA